MATDLLQDILDSLVAKADPARMAVYACGPHVMLQHVTAIARDRAVSCQVSLESTMACGVGACLGCSVPVRSKNSGTISYQRVCREGPVFDSTTVAWDCLERCTPGR